jgi:GTPase SAR1 family protein
METNLVIAIFVGIAIAVFISTATIFFIFRQRYRNLAKKIDEQEIVSQQIADLTETPEKNDKSLIPVHPSAEYRISLWGPKGAGKTTYIAMIYGTALKSNIKWIIRPNDIASTQFVQENINIIRSGVFPTPTAYVQEPNIYRYHIHALNSAVLSENGNEKEFLESVVDFVRNVKSNQLSKKDTSKDIVISLADVAGEQFFNESLDHALWEYLATSDGLICLLDPSEAENHFDITFRLLQFLWLKLKNHPNMLVDGRLPHYVAFCFSKIDQPDFVKFLNKPHDLILYLESQMGLDIEKLLLQYFLPDRITYFTISSIGLQTKIDGPLIENPKDISPINILEPLQWLFRKLEK